MGHIIGGRDVNQTIGLITINSQLNLLKLIDYQFSANFTQTSILPLLQLSRKLRKKVLALVKSLINHNGAKNNFQDSTEDQVGAMRYSPPHNTVKVLQGILGEWSVVSGAGPHPPSGQ